VFDQRQELLEILADSITAASTSGTLRVGVDGVDGAGKTWFADELASAIRARSRPVIRSSVDGFHNPRDTRYQRGRSSPIGFYMDSYNYAALKRFLLEPLSPGGSGCYHKAVFDYVSDSPVSQEFEQAESGSVLVFDGIFLHRPELRGYWDYSIFLEVDFEISIPRGAARGAGFGSPDPEAIENQRYIEGQKQYLRESTPQRYATIVINNNDLWAPRVVKPV